MATKYDLHNPDDVRTINDELEEIHERLIRLLKNGPNELPPELIAYSSPSPRGLGDISRAAHHVKELQKNLTRGYPGLR